MKTHVGTMTLGIKLLLSEGILDKPREQRVLHISFLGSQKRVGKPLHYEPEAAKPIHNLYEVQSDHSEADHGSHSSKTKGSLN